MHYGGIVLHTRENTFEFSVNGIQVTIRRTLTTSTRDRQAQDGHSEHV